LDDFPVSRIGKYETKLYPFMEKEHPEILQALAQKKAIDRELDEKIASALLQFNTGFAGEEKEE
jgi:F-type H+-transporting ATPase subunit alpha